MYSVLSLLEAMVGTAVGEAVGVAVGAAVGAAEGVPVGAAVGAAVGFSGDICPIQMLLIVSLAPAVTVVDTPGKVADAPIVPTAYRAP